MGRSWDEVWGWEGIEVGGWGEGKGCKGSRGQGCVTDEKWQEGGKWVGGDMNGYSEWG